MHVIKIPETGAIILFAPELKLNGKLYAYVPKRDVARVFDPKYLLDYPRVKPDIAQQAIAQYRAWKEKHWNDFIAEEKQLAFLRSRRRKRKKHPRPSWSDQSTGRLIDYTLPVYYEPLDYEEMPRPFGLYREAYCYRCSRHDLNELDNEQCDQCGWLICKCGACGCQFGKDQPPFD